MILKIAEWIVFFLFMISYVDANKKKISSPVQNTVAAGSWISLCLIFFQIMSSLWDYFSR